ncbi:MAG: TrmH family RNA methyltransferase [Terriglobia bacterium]
MREITSPTNPLIKVFRHSLKAGVTREGWLACEGPLLLQEAVAASRGGGEKRRAECGCAVRSVLVAHSAAGKFADLLAQIPPDAEIAGTPDAVFDGAAATVSPQGIAALIEVTPPPLDRVLNLPGVILVAVLGLQDPGNLGTILRSADALGADALITLKPTVSAHNPKILRASGGALFRLPVYPALAAEPLFARLRGAGVRLAATDSHSHRSIAGAALCGPLAFVIGNEAAGLPIDIPADDRVAIPLRGGIDSLNAAVAAGVFLYESARQRGFRY